MKRKMAALAAVSLIFASSAAAAQAAPQDAGKRSASTSHLSLAPAARAGTKGKNESQITGAAGIAVGVILVTASVWGLTEATKGHRPDSP